MMFERMRWLRDELGIAGMISLALVGLAFLFLHVGVKPLQQRSEELREAVRSAAQAASPERAMRGATPAAKLAAFYEFFNAGEQAADWLAKLEAIAKGAGIKLGSGDYHMHKTATRMERYEITLPLAGSYAQIRTFLENALIEIPVMSLDQVAFRRERASELQVQAEVRVTLHLVKP
ncbi:MAG: hypothetical protein A3G27_03260 [Betaproteobacteria bacterium RIFCSPLOWO2_12_FULL_66_14]|nr:MAG: hypothetical protein A3G27_03260 [Betaproteobacteria bacterium RIFCSPLOWO2_12_FULL_66_14]